MSRKWAIGWGWFAPGRILSIGNIASLFCFNSWQCQVVAADHSMIFTTSTQQRLLETATLTDASSTCQIQCWTNSMLFLFHPWSGKTCWYSTSTNHQPPNHRLWTVQELTKVQQSQVQVDFGEWSASVPCMITGFTGKPYRSIDDRWWQLIFFKCSTSKIGEDFQFDEHIFQMGWSQHLVKSWKRPVKPHRSIANPRWATVSSNQNCRIVSYRGWTSDMEIISSHESKISWFMSCQGFVGVDQRDYFDLCWITTWLRSLIVEYPSVFTGVDSVSCTP